MVVNFVIMLRLFVSHVLNLNNVFYLNLIKIYVQHILRSLLFTSFYLIDQMLLFDCLFVYIL